MTPYGFLQSVDIPFVIEDTREIQKKEMQDEIPEGRLTVIKHDADDADQVLEGAEFELFNQTLGISCEKQVTDEMGKLSFLPSLLAAWIRKENSVLMIIW